jgi:hypothetical protein
MSEEPLAAGLHQPGRGEWFPAPPERLSKGRTPERQALAIAIDRHAQAQHRLEALRTARERISLTELERNRDEAAGAVTAARAAAPRQLADRLLGKATAGTLTPIEEAVRHHAMAEAALVEAQGARDLLKDEEGEARTQFERASENRAKAIAEVLRRAPETLAVWHAYVAAHKAIEEIAWVLQVIGPLRLPESVRWDGIHWPPARASGLPWTAAIGALADDPDAALPG